MTLDQWLTALTRDFPRAAVHVLSQTETEIAIDGFEPVVFLETGQGSFTDSVERAATAGTAWDGIWLDQQPYFVLGGADWRLAVQGQWRLLCPDLRFHSSGEVCASEAIAPLLGARIQALKIHRCGPVADLTIEFDNGFTLEHFSKIPGVPWVLSALLDADMQ